MDGETIIVDEKVVMNVIQKKSIVHRTNIKKIDRAQNCSWPKTNWSQQGKASLKKKKKCWPS